MVELRLKEILRGFVQERGFTERLAIYRAYGQWEEIVGPEVARHVRPGHVQRGVLYVVADSGVWAQEFAFARGAVLATLQRSGVPVKELRVHQGTLPAPNALPDLQPPPLRPPAPPGEALDLISDPALRNRFAQLMQSALEGEDPPAPAHRR
ncbi:MAG: DUF721 domain-containing protein [Thermaerobacter sp.]|nr:DUF721 domain-containing protein [Thermaerobacter sp.]